MLGVEFDSSACVQSGIGAGMVSICSCIAGCATHAMISMYRGVCGVQAGMPHTLKCFMGVMVDKQAQHAECTGACT